VLIQRVVNVTRRVPWLLPAASFLAGWAGFAMVRRGEGLARAVALIALFGWVWLLVEPWLRRMLEQRKKRLGNFIVNMVTQSLQQELLFFSLPFLIGATRADFGQLSFTGLVGAAALLSTVDPVYERYVAKRAARRMSFHAFCSWIAALVVLPMVLLLPVERALPASLGLVGAWLLATLPMSLRSLRGRSVKIAWVLAAVSMPIVVWELREHVPAAGLVVTEARLTQTVNDLVPGPPAEQLTLADLERGVVAFAAIRAPTGLAQQVIFEWSHASGRERIVAEIQGGRVDGFRVYSRKRVFPADPLGAWTVDLLTPQKQLLTRLRFTIVP